MFTPQFDAVSPSLLNLPLGPQASMDGAMRTRLDSVWTPPETSYRPYSEGDTNDLAVLRDRARGLEGRNLLACGVLDRYCENLIGTGIRFEPMTKAPLFNQGVRRWLRNWSKPANCDVRGLFGFGEFCALLARHRLRDGDVGMIFTVEPRVRPDGSLDLKRDGTPKRNARLQLIPAQRIKQPADAFDMRMPNGNPVVGGVEMTEAGRPIAYHVAYKDRNGIEGTTRIPARDFRYLFRTGLYENVRGESVFRGTFNLFEQVAAVLDAVVVAWRTGAAQAMVAKVRNPTLRSAAAAVATTEPVRRALQPIQPGMVNWIHTDEELTAFNPAQPQQQMEMAIDVFARILGVKFGLTLEQVLLKFAQVSWSTSKAIRAQSEATASTHREHLVNNAIMPAYQWALSVAVDNGDIIDEEGNPIPAPQNFWDHEWVPPARGSSDPLKDAQTAKELLTIGLDARSFLAAEIGYHFPDVVQRAAADRELMKENDIPIFEDAAAKAGMPTVAPGQDNQPPADPSSNANN